MNLYNGWFDLKPGVSDIDFCEKMTKYMGHLKDEALRQATTPWETKASALTNISLK